MLSTSLQMYRVLVPGHNSVPSATVNAWLEAAASQHSAAAFGAVYTRAMIFWAAAHIEPQVQAGLFPIGGHTSICAPPTVTEGETPKTLAAQDTPYWRAYLDARNSRVATAPFFVSRPLLCRRW